MFCSAVGVLLAALISFLEDLLLIPTKVHELYKQGKSMQY